MESDFPPNYGKPLGMVSRRKPIYAQFRLSPIWVMWAVAGGLMLAAIIKAIVGG